MGRGFAWLDTGTFASLIDAGNFVQTLEERQGMKIACPKKSPTTKDTSIAPVSLIFAKSLLKSGYGDYLHRIVASDTTPTDVATLPTIKA